MIKVIVTNSVDKFDLSPGANRVVRILRNAGKLGAFESMCEELYPDGITETQLSDYLHFDADEIFNALNIKDPDSYDIDDWED